MQGTHHVLLATGAGAHPPFQFGFMDFKVHEVISLLS